MTTVTNTATTPNVVSKFIYDGDGNRVLQFVISGTSILTTAYARAVGCVMGNKGVNECCAQQIGAGIGCELGLA